MKLSPQTVSGIRNSASSLFIQVKNAVVKRHSSGADCLGLQSAASAANTGTTTINKELEWKQNGGGEEEMH